MTPSQARRAVLPSGAQVTRGLAGVGGRPLTAISLSVASDE